MDKFDVRYFESEHLLVHTMKDALNEAINIEKLEVFNVIGTNPCKHDILDYFKLSAM